MDKNDFDICFGCCPNSSWVSVCHTSISHELHRYKIKQPQGLRLSGTQIFWNKAFGHHSLQHKQTCSAAYPQFLYRQRCFNRFMIVKYMDFHIFPTLAEAYAESFFPRRESISIKSSVVHLKLRTTTRAPLGATTYRGSDFYFLTCNLKLNRSSQDN